MNRFMVMALAGISGAGAFAGDVIPAQAEPPRVDCAELKSLPTILDRVSARLRAETAEEATAGVEEAAQLGLVELAPELVTLLESIPRWRASVDRVRDVDGSLEGELDRLTRITSVILDAFADLRAEADGGVIQRWWDRREEFPGVEAAILVLAARDAERNASVLKWIVEDPTASDVAWRVACQTLLAAPVAMWEPRPVLQRLVSMARPRVVVTLVDSEADRIELEASWESRRESSRTPTPDTRPEARPPPWVSASARWTTIFTCKPRPGDVCVSPGASPVFARRTPASQERAGNAEGGAGEAPERAALDEHSREEYAVEVLRQVATQRGGYGGPYLRGVEHIARVRTEFEDLDRLIESVNAASCNAWYATIERIEEDRFIEFGAADVFPGVEIEFVDRGRGRAEETTEPPSEPRERGAVTDDERPLAPASETTDVLALDREIADLLASELPEAIAWGAWHAAQRRRERLAAELQAALARVVLNQTPVPTRSSAKDAVEAVRIREGTRWLFAQWALLDALVRLRIAHDPTLAESLWNPWLHSRETAFILASFDPPRWASALLSRIGERFETMEWIAYCDVLLAARHREFPLRLLETMEIPIEVAVHFGSPGVSRNISCGRWYADLVPGIPPIARFEVSYRPESHDFCCATGPKPFYAHRVDYSSDRDVLIGSSTAYYSDRCDYALESLAVALDLPRETVTLRPSRRVDVIWSDAETVFHRFQEIRDEHEARWRRLLDAAVARGAISAETSSALASPYEWDVKDRRELREYGLPPLPPFPRD